MSDVTLSMKNSHFHFFWPDGTTFFLWSSLAILYEIVSLALSTAVFHFEFSGKTD